MLAVVTAEQEAEPFYVGAEAGCVAGLPTNRAKDALASLSVVSYSLTNRSSLVSSTASAVSSRVVGIL